MRLSLKCSIRARTDLGIKFSLEILCFYVANVWQRYGQAPSYGPHYGERPPTVTTVDPTASLKTVGAIPACHGPGPPAYGQRITVT